MRVQRALLIILVLLCLGVVGCSSEKKSEKSSSGTLNISDDETEADKDLNMILDNYNQGTVEKDEAKAEIEKYKDKHPELSKKYIEKINILANSKDNYAKAEVHMSKEEYHLALSKYGQVISTDSNYQIAMSKKEEATNLYLDEVFARVDEEIENKNFENARNILATTKSFVSDKRIDEKAEEIRKAKDDRNEELATNRENFENGPILIKGTLTFNPNKDEIKYELGQLNIETGEIKSIGKFINPSLIPSRDLHAFFIENSTYSIRKQKKLGLCTSFYLQELFSKDMDKYIYYWEEEDGSKNVGYQMTNGKYVDISNAVHPHTSEFSSKVPQDINPLFSPDGYFFFVDLNNKCYTWVDIDTLEIVKTEAIDDRGETVAFDYNGELFDYQKLAGSPGKSIRLKRNDYEIWPTSDSWDYIDNNRILSCLYDTDGEYIGIIGPDDSIPSKSRYDQSTAIHVTPFTDYYIERMAYSKKFDQILFVANRGSERYIFKVDNKANSEAEIVTTLDDEWTLLFWK